MATRDKIITRAECEYTHVCMNNRCIFRLQKVFGLQHFKQHVGFNEALNSAGVSYAEFPKFELVSKPHSVGISCRNFLGGDDE